MAVKVVEMAHLNNCIDQQKTKVDIMQKLGKECDLLRKLENHPNIVKYYGFLEDQEKSEASIFMEYMPAGTLQSLYREVGPLDESLVKRFTRQIL